MELWNFEQKRLGQKRNPSRIKVLLDPEDEWLSEKFAMKIHSQSKDVTFAYKSHTGHRSHVLHRVVIAASREQFVIHRNGNRLDCRKENLEIVDGSEYLSALPRRKELPGVRPDRTNKKLPWIAETHSNTKTTYIGNFKTAAQATQALKQWKKDNNPYRDMQ